MVYNSTNFFSMGLLSDFLRLDKETWIAKLKKQFVLPTDSSSQAIIDGWLELFNILMDGLDAFNKLNNGFNLIIDYESTNERECYPNVFLLSQEQIIVLFFRKKFVTQAVIDQAASYVRDIKEYHAGSHNINVDGIIALTKTDNVKDVAQKNKIVVCSAKFLENTLLAHFTGFYSLANTSQWINSEYEPLPTVIEATRLCADKKPLPLIKTIQNSNNPKALQCLLGIANEAKMQRKYIVAFVTGGPGTGKTVLGLQIVSNANPQEVTFLSLNKSIISEVKHTLKIKGLVHDFHKCLKNYIEQNSSDFLRNIIVLDDAQYSYTREQMELQHGTSNESEADIMIRLIEANLDWAVVVILVDEKQVFAKQDYSSVEQWHIALGKSYKFWEILCPDSVRSVFKDQNCYLSNNTKYLELTDSLRSRKAINVDRFVNSVIEGNLVASKNEVDSIYESGFCMYITRSLQAAKDYCCTRYEGSIKDKYGLLASSDSRILPSFGVNNSYNTGRLNRWQFLDWFNEDKGSGRSCCDFNSVATESIIQGLELEMPIVCWDTDMLWNGKSWITYDKGSDIISKASEYRKNAYRVLLTRGRDGFIVFIPQVDELNAVYELFKKIGLKEILSDVTPKPGKEVAPKPGKEATPKPGKEATPKPGKNVINFSSSLKVFFESKGLEVIDKRPKGGGLWVVGEREVLTPYLEEANELYGVKGYFAKGKATKQRMGWYTRSDK